MPTLCPTLCTSGNGGVVVGDGGIGDGGVVGSGRTLSGSAIASDQDQCQREHSSLRISAGTHVVAVDASASSQDQCQREPSSLRNSAGTHFRCKNTLASKSSLTSADSDFDELVRLQWREHLASMRPELARSKGWNGSYWKSLMKNVILASSDVKFDPVTLEKDLSSSEVEKDGQV